MATQLQSAWLGMQHFMWRTSTATCNCSALVNKHLHNLILPSTMLKDESGLDQGTTLSCHSDFISLSDSDIIPLRFDSKTYYLDYFVSKSATNDSIVWFADAVYSSPVGFDADDDTPAAVNDTNMLEEHPRPLSELHCGRLNTASCQASSL